MLNSLRPKKPWPAAAPRGMGSAAVSGTEAQGWASFQHGWTIEPACTDWAGDGLSVDERVDAIGEFSAPSSLWRRSAAGGRGDQGDFSNPPTFPLSIWAACRAPASVYLSRTM